MAAVTSLAAAFRNLGDASYAGTKGIETGTWYLTVSAPDVVNGSSVLVLRKTEPESFDGDDTEEDPVAAVTCDHRSTLGGVLRGIADAAFFTVGTEEKTPEPGTWVINVIDPEGDEGRIFLCLVRWNPCRDDEVMDAVRVDVREEEAVE